MKSIVGRFLEHSRIVCFGNGYGLPSQRARVFISSADWMERNLDKRVETCFPVEGKKLITRVKKELESYLSDNTQAWVLQEDGSYIRQSPTGNQNARSVQATLLERLASPVVNTR